MTKKMFLISIAILFIIGACSSTETIRDEPESSVGETDINVAEPTPYPEISKDGVDEVVEEPTPYPGPEDVDWPLVIVDDLGNTVEFQAYPDRIVSLSPSLTEILFAVGAGNQVVGRDEFSVYPEAALEIENVGSLYNEIPVETILDLDPDLVVVAQIVSEEDIQVLLDLGILVFWQENPNDFNELYANILEIAEMTGHPEEADALVAELESRVESVESTLANATREPLVFYELDATDPSNPWTTGSGTFIDYILTKAGGKNAAAELQGEYVQISAEELIAVNPEIILLSDALYGITPESVAERPGWEVITAVQNDAIYPIDPNIMSVPGPRLVDALETTARMLHPELFE